MTFCFLTKTDQLHAQVNSVSLDRVVYLTGNLDSLTKHYIDAGYLVNRGGFDPFGVARDYVLLPSGQTLELQGTGTTDTSDWRRRAIRQYGTHMSGVVFRVPNAAELYLKLDTMGIPHGKLMPGHAEDRPLYLGFGLESPKPLDISFISYNSTVRKPLASTPPNKLRKITWLLLTAGPKEETLVRKTLQALGLVPIHEGCCDYWMIGPPGDRIGFRFELPSTTFQAEGDWLSIEEGGVVINY